MRKILIHIMAGAAFVLALAASYRMGREKGRELAVDGLIAQSDTIYLRDTIRLVGPKEIRYYRTTDTVWLKAPADTTSEPDSLPLPREVREYEDSTYRARVSGIDPRLDWMEVYPRTEVVTRIVKNPVSPKWSLGVSAGIGITATPELRVAPYIGIGIQRNILSW